jgi:hypothetical protein
LLHDLQEHVFQVGAADLQVFDPHAGLAQVASSRSTSAASRALTCTMRPVTRACAATSAGSASSVLKRSMVLAMPASSAGLVQRHHAALLEHRDAAAQRLGLFQVVRGQQHGVALACSGAR